VSKIFKSELSDKLLEDFGDYLFSYALLNIKNKHQAEDIVQETLLAAITAKNNFSNRSYAA